MATPHTPMQFFVEEVPLIALALRGVPTRDDLGRYMRKCENGDPPTFACGIMGCELHGPKELMYNFGPVVLCESHVKAVMRVCDQLHLDCQRYWAFRLAQTWQRMIQIADQPSVIYARRRILEELAQMLQGLRASLVQRLLAMSPPPLPLEGKGADMQS